MGPGVLGCDGVSSRRCHVPWRTPPCDRKLRPRPVRLLPEVPQHVRGLHVQTEGPVPLPCTRDQNGPPFPARGTSWMRQSRWGLALRPSPDPSPSCPAWCPPQPYPHWAPLVWKAPERTQGGTHPHTPSQPQVIALCPVSRPSVRCPGRRRPSSTSPAGRRGARGLLSPGRGSKRGVLISGSWNVQGTGYNF